MENPCTPRKIHWLKLRPDTANINIGLFKKNCFKKKKIRTFAYFKCNASFAIEDRILQTIFWNTS